MVDDKEVRQWAEVGVQREIARLEGVLQGLKMQPSAKVASNGEAKDRRKGRKMSAAARRKISQRMKKYWAEKNA